MKKIAFFVEGQTEQIFIEKLVSEIVKEQSSKGNVKLHVILEKFLGKGKSPKNISPKIPNTPDPTHHLYILDCSNDDGVRNRILEFYNSPTSTKVNEIIGLRDLYPKPLSKLVDLKDEILNGKTLKGGKKTPSLRPNTKFVIAVREIEDWFLAECNHYTCIDPSLTLDAIQVASLGFNPCTDDLTTRTNEASKDLHDVYQLATPKKGYNKNKDRVEKTVDCLDYTHIRTGVRSKFPALNELIEVIEAFLI